MERWLAVRDVYFAWLREVPLLTHLAEPGDAPEIISSSPEPVRLNAAFWWQRTHEVEALALRQLEETEIDAIFEEVAAVLDESPRRFAPLTLYYAHFLPNGDTLRIKDEREVAASIKRDLSWLVIEQIIGRPGFFHILRTWYERGRWPCDWQGEYPAGHVRVL